MESLSRGKKKKVKEEGGKRRLFCSYFFQIFRVHVCRRRRAKGKRRGKVPQGKREKNEEASIEFFPVSFLFGGKKEKRTGGRHLVSGVRKKKGKTRFDWHYLFFLHSDGRERKGGIRGRE